MKLSGGIDRSGGGPRPLSKTRRGRSAAAASRLADRVAARLGYAVLAAALLAALPSAAQVGAGPAGSVFRSYLPLNGKQVPLPEGDWVLAGDSYEVLPSVAGGAGDAVESVVLLQVSGSRVSAFVMAQRNAIGVDKGWGLAPECNRTDLYAAIAYENSDTHAFCGFATSVATAASPQDAALSWTQALDYARRHGLTLPGTWLMAGFRISNLRDVIDVRYHFDPALAGMPGETADRQDADGAAARLDEGAAAAPESWSAMARRWVGYAASLGASEPEKPSPRRAAVAALVAWLDAMRYPVELGFKNRLSGVPGVPEPWGGTTAALAATPALTTRLQQLEALRSANVLSAAQHDVQLAIIESEHASVAAGRWTAEGLTTVKAGTNQVSTNIAAFAADYLMTGNVATSLSLIGVHTVIDVGQYWSTEWAWNTFGPRKIETVTTVDLLGTGSNGSPPVADLPFQSPALQRESDGTIQGHPATPPAPLRQLGALP
jgi:hypothetical protein